MAKFQASWKSALTPQKAPTYGNQGMLIASPKELQVSNVDYVVVFEGTKKYHVAIADIVNPYTLYVVIPEHDIAEEVVVKVYVCQDNNLNILTHLKFTYISQMEHAIAKFLAHSASDAEVAEKLDALWTVCLGKDHLELWDKRLAQAFAQLELPIEWTLVGDILQKESESHETLLHFAARHGLKELINVFLNLPGAKQALSTYNKSGLLPRDVARESGLLDIAELLDSERSTEQRKSGTFKDSTRRKVRRNNDNGVTTITNLRSHNVQDDIQFLRDLNKKLKAKRNSPVSRHSWPIEIQSFHPDDYSEELEKGLSKVTALREQNNTKRSFIDDNLIQLSDIREEICNLRSWNAEEASKELSMIADRNRRPAHSRRLSCPGSVERQRRAAGGLPNLKSRPESSASERSIGNQEEPANPAAAETVFSTPPMSPKVGQLVNLASPTITSPGPEGTFQLFDDAPESFMTPPSNTPSSSPQPKSPMPISLKCSDAEKRPNTGRKGRPRTWYGGAADIPHVADEELRRSNSLEDFGKALDEGSDDESITSAASEANSKEGLLQTLCSLTEKESRTESFVSSISDTSIGKESVGSDIEDDCELEYTHEGIQGEIVKDIEGYEGIQEREHEYTKDGLEGHEETGKGDTHNHGDLDDVERIQEEEETGIHGVVEEHKEVDNRDIHENEKIEINGKLDQIADVEKHESHITAGSNVRNNDSGDVENECQDTEHKCKDAEHDLKDTEHECRNSEHECIDTEQESKNTGEEFKDTLMEHECRNSEHECNDTEQESKNTEEEFKDTLMEHECKETENECRDRNDLEHEQTEVTEAATHSNVEEDIVSRVDKQEENHERESPYENTYNGQQDNEVETSVVCNGAECDVQEHEHAEEHIQNEVIGDENMRGESMEKNTAVGTSGQGDCNKDFEEELSNDNKESQLNEEHQCGEPGLEPLEDVVQQDSHADPGDSETTEDTASGENQLPHEDVSMENSSEEINHSHNSNDDANVEETLTNKVADDRPEKNETSPEGNEDDTKESEGRSCGSEDVEEKPECLQAESENRPTESGNIERESEDRSAEPEDRPTEPENRQTEFEDRPTESENHSAESKNLPKESEDRTVNQANDPEIGIEDAEDKSESTDDNSSVCQTKIKFEDLDDIECNVQDFCLPGQNTERNKELFRIQATDDVESGEDSDPGSKHIRFDEKPPSLSPMAEERSPTSPEENFCGPMRTRSALLLGVKIPVKRSGSDISVMSLQDVELQMHVTNRDNDLTPGVLNNSRKAKSFGDLSTFSEGLSEMTKDEGDDSEEERRRIQEDHTVLNRVKKYEQASKYASNEQLEQISTSRIITEREEEKQNQRRWSNFFNTKNPKPGKKPGRTPTFRRDNNLRSSMSSIGKGSKSAAKSTVENLVAGPHSAAFAKHSQTAPNLHVTVSGRPRSFTKDSPGQIRKSPTVSSIDSEEQKTESPDEVEIQNEDINFEVDSDLENFDKEPEAWSVTVEPYMLKKMKKNEIKRQDVILELIQTEGHHVRTLKIMQQVFYRGLHKVANYPEERLDELFPRINDLIDISARFYRNLRCRQDENASVRMIGDVIVKQFGGDNGELVKQAYGEFVSKHPEALASYKHYFKTDKKFSNFIKKCHGHRIVRRLSVPECFTLVTQRMTKYPLLLEAILKVTKSSNADHKELQKALLLVKDATKAVDNAIKDYEKQSRLKDIKMRIEKGSVVVKSGQKIKNSRFVEYNSKMIHDGILQWKNARGKLTETHVVLLESMVAFLQENDKKFSLLSIDGKSPCIALKTLMVREVATDKCAIYFVSTSKKGPEMYEFVSSSQKEKRLWCAIINDAIAKAPEDTGVLFYSPEEEKKLAEERLKRRSEILEIMKGKDKELSDLVEEKNKLANEMKDLWQMPEGNGKTKEDERISSNERARSILLSAIHRTTQLTADTVLIHESHSDSELAAATYDDKKASSPKRAETFGGFDRRPSQKASRRPTTTIPEGKSEENQAAQRRDSGLSLASESVVGLNTLSQGQEVGGSTSFQMLEALQWVLVQFSRQETSLETLRMELQTATEDIKRIRSVKIENDKKNVHMKEEDHAELTRQKKAYSDLERTFNLQVSELKLQLSSQQEKHETLLQNFSELRLALTNK